MTCAFLVPCRALLRKTAKTYPLWQQTSANKWHKRLSKTVLKNDPENDQQKASQMDPQGGPNQSKWPPKGVPKTLNDPNCSPKASDMSPNASQSFKSEPKCPPRPQKRHQMSSTIIPNEIKYLPRALYLHKKRLSHLILLCSYVLMLYVLRGSGGMRVALE